MKAAKDPHTTGNLMKHVTEVNNVHLMTVNQVFQWEYNKAGTPVR